MLRLETLHNHIKNIRQATELPLAFLVVALLPWKLSLTLIPLVLLDIQVVAELSLGFLTKKQSLNETMPHENTPLLLFLGYVIVSSGFGLDPVRSISNLPTLVLYCFTIPAIASISSRIDPTKLLKTLVFSQAIVGTNAILNSAFPDTIDRYFLGKVTESGQIAMTLVLATGLSLATLVKDNPRTRIKHSVMALVLFAALLALEFKPLPANSALGALLIPSIAALSLLTSLYQSRHAAKKIDTLLLTVALPLIAATLMANLKRGPLAGVVISITLLLFLNFRRLLLPALLSFTLVLVLVEPIRVRLEQSGEHFFISGGRSLIWQIGAELAARFPLGIGYQNSRILQRFSAEIPSELRHFHSNFLNILVETGWIGLALFIWWIANNLSIAFEKRASPDYKLTLNTLGAALISWQIAGVVEYNFGDSEVLIIAFVIMGVLASFKKNRTPA